MTLTKQQAIDLFGTAKSLGAALGITGSAVGQWPDELDQRLTDEIVGMVLRLGKQLPAGFVIEQSTTV